MVSTCGRAKRLLGYIHRQFHHCGKPTILRLYRSLVLPLWDYCCYVWDPHLIKNVNLLEYVLVFACKIATRSWSESHINLRSECNLPPLAVRRAYFKYSCCFSYHKLAYCPHNFLQPRPSSSIRARGAHSFQLICPFARTNSCMYSFVHASIRLWNKLPTSNAQVTSYPLFKKLIRKHLCMC